MTSNVPSLSTGAQRLLDRLKSGAPQEIAEPSVYPGPMAFADHAEVYLRNAAEMCREPRYHDFIIFGGFYGVRHGLELWLKCLAINRMIDATLRAILDGAESVEQLQDKIMKGGISLKRKQLDAIQHSLCAMRNVDEDGIKFPRCWKVNMTTSDAARALKFIQRNPKLPRYHLGYCWKVPIAGHFLDNLLEQAVPLLDLFHQDAQQQAQTSGCGHPLPREEISSAVELLDHLDHDGDTFRYPSSLTGEWHIQLPAVSLAALGDLAEALAETVLAYDSVMTQLQCHSTLGAPWTA